MQLQTHKNLFVIIALGLLLLELQIFAMAALKSGPQTHLQILDAHNNVLYRTQGNHLADHARIRFEKTFGPLANYRVHLVTEDRPFPFRAWLAAAVGLPMSTVLLFGLMVKTYRTLFIRDEPKETLTETSPPGGRMERLINRISRFNVFVLATLLLTITVSLWAVPYMLVDLGRHSVEILNHYKWMVIPAVAILLVLVVWIIYLRYRLARKAIEAQAEVEKYRLELEYTGLTQDRAQLPRHDPPQIEAPKDREGTLRGCPKSMGASEKG